MAIAWTAIAAREFVLNVYSKLQNATEKFNFLMIRFASFFVFTDDLPNWKMNPIYDPFEKTSC